MSRQTDIWAYGTTQVIVPPGATNAVLVIPQAGFVSSIVKYATGGSLAIVGVPNGTTYTGAQLAALAGTGYILGTAEAVSEDGPVRYYLMATGATATAYMINGISVGI